METSGRGKQKGRGSRSSASGREWVGGRGASPFVIAGDSPHRPELTLWIEMPDAAVVAFQLGDPDEAPVSFGATLLEAMKAPMVGRPRRPAVVRVAGAGLAAEVRRVLPEARVVVAPTPEVQFVVEQMAEALAGERSSGRGGGEDASYFEEGRVSLEVIEDLFRAAENLYRVAPWKAAGDSQLLRVDIPAYEVEAACLSIIGNLGENLGLILFPSLEGFERFLDVARVGRARGAPLDLGTTTLSLNFEADFDLPPRMLREAREHGWPVQDSRAYPVVVHRDSDGASLPLNERDIRVMSASALSLTSFFLKHGGLFKRKAFEPICESWFDDNDIEVRFTMPYEAWPEFAVNRPPRPDKAATHRAPAVSGPAGLKLVPAGRNQPCPCGSGKKYKNCCLNGRPLSEPGRIGPLSPADVAEARAANLARVQNLVERMDRYAQKRFGPRWMVPAAAAFRDISVPQALLAPWAIHHHLLDGKPLVRWFLEDEGARLPEFERAWLKAHCSAWLSVWEVVDAKPGTSLSLRDLLTGESRLVGEVTGSQTLVKRDVVLARMVDFPEGSLIEGIYPRSLPPMDAAVVVDQARARLRRRNLVPVERMRAESVGRYLIACWEDAVEEANLRASIPPVIVNTDREPLLLTVDHFAFDSADRLEIQRRLSAAEEVDDPPGTDDPEQEFIFSRPGNAVNRGWESTLIGRAVISGNALRMESNSIKRADGLRKRLDALLGPLVTYRIRSHADPMAAVSAGVGRGEVDPSEPPPDELNRVLLDMKTKHYADWADYPLPALAGKTPRAAARTKPGRQKVDLLLKEMERSEGRLPAGQRFDFGPIRRELGLEG